MCFTTLFVTGAFIIVVFRIHVEYAIEFTQHQAEHACWNAKCRAEHDPNVSHRHLVDTRILHNQDQVCS